MRTQLILIISMVLLLLLTACSLSPTANVIREARDIGPICSVGVEVRASDFGEGNCFDSATDSLHLEIDSLDQSIYGILVELKGTKRNFSEKFRNERYKAFTKYDVNKIDEKVGSLKEVIVYPISLMDDEYVVCDTHPFKILWDEC